MEMMKRPYTLAQCRNVFQSLTAGVPVHQDNGAEPVHRPHRLAVSVAVCVHDRATR
jgi:hypothetical protein